MEPQHLFVFCPYAKDMPEQRPPMIWGLQRVKRVLLGEDAPPHPAPSQIPGEMMMSTTIAIARLDYNNLTSS